MKLQGKAENIVNCMEMKKKPLSKFMRRHQALPRGKLTAAKCSYYKKKKGL